MDFAELKRQIEASRQTEAKLGAATFKLRLPEEHVWCVANETHRDAHGHTMESRASREVLDAALIGWEGVTLQDLLQDAPAEPLPFSPAAKTELLNSRQDVADLLAMTLGLKIIERRETREAARKNSSSGSSGN